MQNIINSMAHDSIATFLPRNGPMPPIVIDWGIVDLSKIEWEYVKDNMDHTTYPSGKTLISLPQKEIK